jgi:conjugal transfer pilus assembly protein TrbC
VKAEGGAAIANATQAKTTLSKVNIKQLDLTATQNEIQQSKSLFNHTKPLSNTLPSGQKYYLYSESIVSDSKQEMAQYTKPALDINQTISDYNAMLSNAKAQIGDSRLLIFVSSSMPKKALTNLMQQSSAIGAIFVIKGLINGSYVNTYRYFYNLKGQNTVGIMINPTLFSAFKVDQVPTYALYQSKQDLLKTTCKAAPEYTKVSGEVTVKYALEQLQRSKISNLAQIASNELDILDQQNFYGRKK